MTLAILRRCKLASGLFMVVMITGMAAVWHAANAREQAAKALDRTRHEEISRRTAQEREATDYAEIVALEQRVQALEEAGFIGDEKRLDWVDTLHAIRRSRQLFKIDYEIGPQQKADPALVGNPIGPWVWRMSPMRIQLSALHEGDLINLLDKLRAQSRPWLHIQRCSLQRAEQPRPQGPAAQLDAQCQLQWVSAQREGAKQ